MFMLKVYKNITGYVSFFGKGVFPERFLNLCAKEQILVWDAKADVNEIQGKMYIKDYKSIKRIAKKSCMRLHITKRHGLPFLINRYKYRYGIAIGAFLFFFILWYLSGFCFNITINSTNAINKEKVLNSLEKCGVYIGKRINKIDAEQTRQKFLIKNKDYSWAALNIKGCFVEVVLVKTNPKKMKNTQKAPCNIIAKTDGEILKIKAYNGRVSVKIGEAVAKGDLLVSGAVELSNKSTKFVHSNAEVIAKTRHNLKVFVPFNTTQKLYDKDTKKRSVLTIANINIPLFLGEIKKPYISTKKTKHYSLLGVELPFKKTTAYFKKITNKKVKLNNNQAKQLAIEKMNKKSQQLLGKTIVSSENGNFRFTNKGVYYSKAFICEQNIAKKQRILK